MQVARAIAASLARCDFEAAFCLLGSGNLAIANGLRDAGARVVSTAHEASAVSAADAYARVTGRVGLATVSQGPGVTNVVTALAEAAKSHSPLVLVAGEAPAAAIHSNFRIEQENLVRAVGAATDRIYGPETVEDDVLRAFARAREGVPVVLMAPTDIQKLPCRPGSATPAPAPAPTVPIAAAVAAVADVVQAAQRVAIVAGRGAVWAQAEQTLSHLGEITGAILSTTAVAKGMFARNPSSVGIAGGFATSVARAEIAACDVVLAFGAALNEWTLGHGRMVGPGARIVQVDANPHAIGAQAPVALGVVGDARETALALVSELERRGHRASAGRRSFGDGHADAPPQVGARDRVDPRSFTRALDAALPTDRAIVVDSGHFLGFPAMLMEVGDPTAFVFPQAFQAVGVGLGAAIGAAVARPDRVTVAAVGDGGALMALGELATLRRADLPVLIAVYNDAAYGAEVHAFGPAGEAVDLVRFPDTDFAAIARGAGCEAITVRCVDDVEPVATWASGPSGPLLVDAKVDPGVCAEWFTEVFGPGGLYRG